MKLHLLVVIVLLFISACGYHHYPKTHTEYNQYKDSLKHGAWVEMNDSLQMIEICGYKNGIRHGKYYRFYENGNIARKGRYKNGKKHSWWFSYGPLSGAQKYKKGVIVSSIHNNPRF